MTSTRLAGATFTLALMGCGGAPAKPALHATGSAVSTNAPIPDEDWGSVVSPRFFLALPLPDRGNWTIDDKSGRWLVATHLPSRSMIWLRSWREGSVVGHAACEAEARGFRPDLFGKDETALSNRKPLDAPSGFDSEVGFSVHSTKTAVGGVAALFAAHIRQCVVMAYATRADGANAARVVGERMGFVTARIFARAESVTIDDRVAPVRGAALKP
jgi:hypothetical protein